MNDKRKLLSFIKLKEVKPMMDWDDIKEGQIYHMPPLIYNKRMDFLVVEKKEKSMRIKKIGDTYCQIIFKSDITTRFIIKKIDLYGKD